MTYTLQQHIARLGKGTHRSAYILHSTDINTRALCKSLRERMRNTIGVDQHTVVWATVEGGVLFMCSGSLIVGEILASFLNSYQATGKFTTTEVIRTSGRKVFNAAVQTILEQSRVKINRRSYGGSR